jgi:hypothetical protein
MWKQAQFPDDASRTPRIRGEARAPYSRLRPDGTTSILRSIAGYSGSNSKAARPRAPSGSEESREDRESDLIRTDRALGTSPSLRDRRQDDRSRRADAADSDRPNLQPKGEWCLKRKTATLSSCILDELVEAAGIETWAASTESLWFQALSAARTGVCAEYRHPMSSP